MEVRTLDTKQHILDEAGFVYNFDRMVYINRKSKKIISVEFADDNDEKVLERVVREDTDSKEWKLYFNAEPSEPAKRTVEDRLREEYFTLLPEIRRVAERLEAEIRYLTLPISGTLDRHERMAVTCRVKSCDSALDKLRRHQETTDRLLRKEFGSWTSDPVEDNSESRRSNTTATAARRAEKSKENIRWSRC